MSWSRLARLGFLAAGILERSDIVSLIIDALHELRQRRPVALSEESLVDLAGQRRPPLLR